MGDMTQQPAMNLRGAVDLSALAARSSRPSAAGAAAPGAAVSSGAGALSGPGATAYVVDVTEASFQAEVVERSMTVPVVVDLWAEWCQPCKQLSPVLERLAEADGGRWLLAKVDIDANQRIAQAFGVQSIPAVFAVLKGQPVPLFEGALPEAQVRQYLDELLRVAEANGVTGQAEASGDDAAAALAAEPVEPELDDAYAAIERGDLDGAADAYRRLLARRPADSVASAGLAQVELLRRAARLDPATVRRDAAERPDDVQVQCNAADLDMLGGDLEQAFSRLVELVRRSSGDERDRVRQHLLDLFELVGEDPRVARARTALASALF
jgi:putative thioredoxin